MSPGNFALIPIAPTEYQISDAGGGLQRIFSNPSISWKLTASGEKLLFDQADVSTHILAGGKMVHTLTGFGLVIAMRFNISPDRITIQPTLENKSSTRIVNTLDFCLNGKPAGDVLAVFPKGPGWAFSLSRISPEHPPTVTYPLRASMQWTALYRDDLSLYFGVHDEQGLYKRLTFLPRQEGFYQLSWQLDDLELNPRESFSGPPLVIALTDAGWYGAGQVYAGWVKEHVKPVQTPEWYHQNPTWAWVGCRQQFGKEFLHTLDELPEAASVFAGAGVELSQLTGYIETGHDTCFPDYVPGDSFGGEAGLRDAIRDIHRQGRKIGIYVNGRIVDPAASLTAETRDSWVVRKTPDGERAQEDYGILTFDIMCPGAAGWRECFIERLVYLFSNFDLDGLYIDQICAAEALPCYNSTHEHAHPNQAWAFTLPFMRAIREKLTAIKPDIYIASEGVHDFFGQVFDSLQAHQDWVPFECAFPLHSLYRSVFPGQTLLSGAVTDAENGRHFLKVAHLTGGGIDYAVQDWEIFDSSFLAMSRRIIGWRKKNADALRFGCLSPLNVDQPEWAVNQFSTPEQVVICGVRLQEEAPAGQPLTFAVKIQEPDRHSFQAEDLQGSVSVRISVEESGGVKLTLTPHEAFLIQISQKD